jgi:hypothetical protein
MNFNPLPYLARIRTGWDPEEGHARLAFLVSPTHALTTADAIARPDQEPRTPSGPPPPPTFLDFPDNPSIGKVEVF